MASFVGSVCAGGTGSGTEDNVSGNDDVYEVERKRSKRWPSTSDTASCENCEFTYGKYKWKTFTRYEPSQTGIELYEMCAVSYAGRELYTYAEGYVGHARPEASFPYVCGELVSSKRLAPASKLKNVYAKVHATTESVAFATDQPLHAQQQQYEIKQESGSRHALQSVPMTVDRKCMVLVFRTSGESLFLQLMPTLYSAEKLLPGMPLFDKMNRGVAAAVGNMFSEFEYVVNCTPVDFLEIPLPKGKYGSERLKIVCVDTRSIWSDEEKKSSIIPSASATISKMFQQGATPNSKRDQAEIIFNGVVNERLQVTDIIATTNEKKSKASKHLLTVSIDDGGIEVTLVDETEKVVLRWSHKDPNVLYSIMPRRYYDARTNIVTLNTKVRQTKNEMKRYKSVERLI